MLSSLHLTLNMATAQVVETSVTNNSLCEDYSHPDGYHTWQTIFPMLVLCQALGSDVMKFGLQWKNK